MFLKIFVCAHLEKKSHIGRHEGRNIFGWLWSIPLSYQGHWLYFTRLQRAIIHIKNPLVHLQCKKKKKTL